MAGRGRKEILGALVLISVFVSTGILVSWGLKLDLKWTAGVVVAFGCVALGIGGMSKLKRLKGRF